MTPAEAEDNDDLALAAKPDPSGSQFLERVGGSFFADVGGSSASTEGGSSPNAATTEITTGFDGAMTVTA